MKKYLFGILAIAMAVGFSAFTTKKAPKPFASVDVYYSQNMVNQRVEQGYDANDVPAISQQEYTITPATFITRNKWQTTSVSFTQYTSGAASYIGKFTIDNQQTNDVSDEDDSNGISVQEALDAISTALTSGGLFYYPTSTSYTLAVDTDVTPGNDVTVRNFIRATAVH